MILRPSFIYSYVHIICPGHDLKLTAGPDNVNSTPQSPPIEFHNDVHTMSVQFPYGESSMQGISDYIWGGDLDLAAIPDISIKATFPKCSNYLSSSST